MDSIDDLLAQVKAEYDQPAAQQSQQKKIQTEQLEQQQLKRTSPIDNLLAQVKADYEKQNQAEELKIQQQLQEAQRQQKQIEQQEFEAIKIKAIAWLKELDPLSTEGIWFENFAKTYSSKLAAAIDYLQSV